MGTGVDAESVRHGRVDFSGMDLDHAADVPDPGAHVHPKAFDAASPLEVVQEEVHGQGCFPSRGARSLLWVHHPVDAARSLVRSLGPGVATPSGVKGNKCGSEVQLSRESRDAGPRAAASLRGRRFRGSPATDSVAVPPTLLRLGA